MKTRKEMSQQDLDKAPVTFHDVAAYFSEEEWKLLHEWQKELYRNAMKEIHQTLLSLGYAIVNPATLLRFNKREATHHWDGHQDSGRRAAINDPTSSCYPSVCPDVLFRIKQEENLYCKDRYVPEETKMYTSPCKGDGVTNPDDLFKVKIEENSYLKDPWDTEGRERNECLSTGFPFLSTDDSLRIEEESNESLTDRPVSEGEESSTGPSSEHAVITSVISFVIKEEGETYSIGHEDSWGKGSIMSPTGDPEVTSDYALRLKPEEETHFHELPELLNEKNTARPLEKLPQEHQRLPPPSACLKEGGHQLAVPFLHVAENFARHCDSGMDCERKDEDSATYTETNPSCKTLSKRVKAMMPHSFRLGTNSRSQVWSDSNQGLGGERTVQCESSLNYPEPYNVLQQPAQVETSEKHNESEASPRNAKLPITQHNKLQNWRPYTFSECEKNFRQTMGLIPQQRTHTVKTSYRFADFEKTFSLKQRMVRHQRTYTGTRLYQCGECDKSFKMKDHLMRHRRIHTGERPYHCTQCEKTFSQKHHLTGHQRTHTGERPYQCTKCRKSFTQKGSLIRHNRTHTGERPYQCTECGQSFSLKEALIRHQRAHVMT